MNKRERREVVELGKRMASWDHLRAGPWSPEVELRPDDVGRPRLRIVYEASFEPGLFWEVCESAARWGLYRARVVGHTPFGPLMVQGYEPVAFDSEALREYVG